MQKFNFFERMMLMECYWPKLLIDFIGLSLFTNFLSQHVWIPAVSALLISLITGLAITWKKDYRKFAVTQIGKVMLAQAKPLNILICAIGLILFCYGSWLDNYFVIAAGGIIGLVSTQYHLHKWKVEAAREKQKAPD